MTIRTSNRTILVLGAGAREHALARRLARSASVARVWVGPGNAGTERPFPGQSAAIQRASLDYDPARVIAFAQAEAVDLVVVGPETPLAAGIVDALQAAAIPAFGPTRAAAQLEASKAFLKRFAERHGIPTAPFLITSSYEEAEAHIRERGAPIVVKADGLCAGKGVVVAQSVEEALDAARSMLVDRVFGDAGATIIIEACLKGLEASVHVIADGERFSLLPAARDHKRALEGDRGPNTGGMGVIAPVPDLDAATLALVERTIVKPTLDGMAADGAPFRGVLFAGLMLTAEGPFLLEHNVRFGDPECEALMELIEGDVADILADAAEGKLDPARVSTNDRHVCVIVVAAENYPAAPRLGDEITGIEAAEALGGVLVHHAGTALRGAQLVTAGGRVFAVTAVGDTAVEARALAYEGARSLTFAGAHYRKDIGLGGSSPAS